MTYRIELAETAKADLREATRWIRDQTSLVCSPRRLVRILESYRKPPHGVVVAKRIGVDNIMKERPHFREWIERIQSVHDLIT